MARSPDPQAVHVVLGAGGVRCLAYAGALQALRAAGISFASVSACSAGTFVAALICAGVSPERLGELVRGIDLPRLAGPRVWPWNRLRYPFAGRSASGFAAYFQRIVAGEFPERAGREVCLGDLQIPFATTVVDLLSHELLVYSSESHPRMPMAEVLSIAVAAPTMYPPHERDGRLLVDSAVVSSCPVWLAGAHSRPGERAFPTLALGTGTVTEPRRPAGLLEFLPQILGVGVEGRDRVALETLSRTHRVKRVEVRTAIRFDQFDLREEERVALVNTGYRAVQEEMDDIIRWLQEPAAPRRAETPGGWGSDVAHPDTTAAEFGRQVINHFFINGEVRVGDQFGDNAIVGSQISNSAVNLGSVLEQVEQRVQTAPLDAGQREELGARVAALRTELESLAKSDPDAAALIASRLEEVVKLAAKEPEKRNPALLQISAKGLEEAATTIGKILPGLITAAAAVAKFVTGM